MKWMVERLLLASDSEDEEGSTSVSTAVRVYSWNLGNHNVR